MGLLLVSILVPKTVEERLGDRVVTRAHLAGWGLPTYEAARKATVRRRAMLHAVASRSCVRRG